MPQGFQKCIDFTFSTKFPQKYIRNLTSRLLCAQGECFAKQLLKNDLVKRLPRSIFVPKMHNYNREYEHKDIVDQFEQEEQYSKEKLMKWNGVKVADYSIDDYSFSSGEFPSKDQNEIV